LQKNPAAAVPDRPKLDSMKKKPVKPVMYDSG